jgi:uncharacterized protein with GYD domain
MTITTRTENRALIASRMAFPSDSWNGLKTMLQQFVAETKRKGRKVMARYIALLTYTDQGAKNIKKSTSRAHTFDKLAEKSGVKIEGQYWTLGRYDGVLILNADDEAKALHWLTELAALGNVRTHTLQAFVDDEFEKIAGSK